MRAASRTVLASSPPSSAALEPVRCSRCLSLQRSLHCTVSFSRPPRVSPPRHAQLFHFGPAPSSASLGRTGGARSLWAWTPGHARDRRETSSRASAGNPLMPPCAHRPLALAPSLAGSSRSARTSTESGGDSSAALPLLVRVARSARGGRQGRARCTFRRRGPGVQRPTDRDPLVVRACARLAASSVEGRAHRRFRRLGGEGTRTAIPALAGCSCLDGLMPLSSTLQLFLGSMSGRAEKERHRPQSGVERAERDLPQLSLPVSAEVKKARARTPRRRRSRA